MAKSIKRRTKCYAKYLRDHPTPSEAELWAHLVKKLMGVRCRRQAPILGWIADFYFPQSRLVVELDGSFHRIRTAEDQYRDAIFATHDVRTLRIASSRVFTDIDNVITEIRAAL